VEIIMTSTELALLQSDIESALQRASLMKLEMVVYILTMAKLELETEMDDRKLRSLVQPKGAVFLQ
jgi:hypothetical protein